MDKTYVVSISGVSGSGKTTITKQLEAEYDNAIALYFDDYHFANAPTDFASWVKRGANYNEWKLDPFVHDVKRYYETANLTIFF
ncbi:hypothetical protein [Virgibacillus chiguensis]|uniref:Uridine kinase n=1 Tax=Virgibacillus chiguensis TaxID=411959 RepID=A0A1M5VW07_9BACI|nr:hypothetical protein [Virgibacillus chiguensis]SHH79489.1 hypothetical protein SAMN05421807_1143 [Virgibacillus chiguensis]